MQRKNLLATSVSALFLCQLAPAQTPYESMMIGSEGFRATPLFTIGETINGYTPPGILDGLGAFKKDANTVRVYANHELLNFRGYPYPVEDGSGGTFNLIGARVSYFDIDIATMQVVDAGQAYQRVYDSNGNQASDITFLPEPQVPFFGTGASQHQGFSRFCSSALFEAEEFGNGRGLEDRLYFTGEEDGSGFNSVGGLAWALDTASGDFWAVPAFGRGAWENMTTIDTGSDSTVAMLLADDSSPFDADSPFSLSAGTGDADAEAAPLCLYVGTKNPSGDILDRNGLRNGTLYVWVPNDQSKRTPAEFNASGTLAGTWVAIDNSPDVGQASIDGSTGYDEYGYPTQRMLWLRAEAAGAFGFSRPEDVATSPYQGNVAILASTGVDTYVNGADTFGTLYTITTDFSDMSADVTITYDGDADPSRALRSPDNLEWADDGFLYVQEDEAEEDTLSGEPLFGIGAVNPNEAGIVRVDPVTGETLRVGNIDRFAIVDPTIANPLDAVDQNAGAAGEWESSGIIDVSSLFGRDLGTLFLIDVQAHGIEDQENVNPASRINDGDLVEGGQLLFFELKSIGENYCIASANSAGDGAAIRAEGSALVSDNDLILSTSGVPSGSFGIYVAGSSQALTPFGDGFLCLDGLTRIDPSVSAGADGVAAIEVDLNTAPAGSMIAPGMTTHFQLWYRDIPAGQTGFNLSNGISVTWQ